MEMKVTIPSTALLKSGRIIESDQQVWSLLDLNEKLAFIAEFFLKNIFFLYFMSFLYLFYYKI